jgi:glycosyltransferase involved in cell wall biosynthesis
LEVPSVTIVIPCYNSERFIKETLTSALSQEGHKPHILAVDDGSTDATAEIIKRYPVRLVSQTNAGDSAARNTGLGLVETEFVIFLDHDDILEPRAISHHIDGFRQQFDTVMMIGSNYLIDHNGQRCGVNILNPRRFSARDVVMGTTPSFSQCMYRTVDLKNLGGFRTKAGAGADHDINLRLLGRCREGYIHGNMVMSYRLHAGQQTKSPSRLFSKHLEILEEHLQTGGIINDPSLLNKARSHWAFYYGQFFPGELYRAAANAKFSVAFSIVKLSLRHFPHSIRGAASHLTNRFRKRQSMRRDRGSNNDGTPQ